MVPTVLVDGEDHAEGQAPKHQGAGERIEGCPHKGRPPVEAAIAQFHPGPGNRFVLTENS